MNILIVKGDITEVKADAIVNAANRELRNGAGVCGAIHAKAGPEMETWGRNYNQARDEGILVGDAVVSSSFNMKNCDKVIHTVGPIYNPDYTEHMEDLLACAYNSALRHAENLNLRSIAFPAISTGVYGYPPEEAVEVVKNILLSTSYNGKIILVCFSDTDYRLYKKVIKPMKIKFRRAYENLL